ncbi:MAG: hypothetical protein OEL20_05290 [Sulfuritalea sp.]|nr:hypothetical protein [Sulfuritalea sp.]
MNLSHCTLTGVDDATDLTRLAGLSRDYPIVEWGFLYSPKRQGQPGRYPSVATLQRAFRELPADVRVALHVCGEGVPDLLAGESVVRELVSRVAARGGRVQLNFNQHRKPVDLIDLRRFLDAMPATTVITQHNSANQDVWRELHDRENHAVLFDASGGNGVLPAQWPHPLPEVACGYAGGLGPDTLYEHLARIDRAAEARPFWIDMEGRLRAGDREGIDRLSLDRCRFCLEIVALRSAFPAACGTESHEARTPQTAAA